MINKVLGNKKALASCIMKTRASLYFKKANQNVYVAVNNN